MTEINVTFSIDIIYAFSNSVIGYLHSGIVLSVEVAILIELATTGDESRSIATNEYPYCSQVIQTYQMTFMIYVQWQSLKLDL